MSLSLGVPEAEGAPSWELRCFCEWVMLVNNGVLPFQVLIATRRRPRQNQSPCSPRSLCVFIPWRTRTFRSAVRSIGLSLCAPAPRSVFEEVGMTVNSVRRVSLCLSAAQERVP